MYSQSLRQSHWEANNIDIFVGTYDHIQLVMQYYNDLVARPLQLDVETVSWRTYCASREPVASLPDEADVEDDNEQFSPPPPDLCVLIAKLVDDNLHRLVGHNVARHSSETIPLGQLTTIKIWRTRCAVW